MNKVVKLILVVIGVVITALLCISLYFTYSITSPRNSQSPEPVLVEILPGSSISKISQQLSEKRLIDSTIAFEFYARFGPAHAKLIPGPYLLKGNMSIKQIIEQMADGKVAVTKITVPEGVTINKVARLWVASGAGTEAEFKAALNLKYDYSFLNDRTAATLEGYLAPSTYEVPYKASPTVLIKKMLDKFSVSVRPILYGANESGLSPADVLTLSSVVELEANNPVDRKLVAGIFLNRLTQGIKLQSDVTVNYATGKTDTKPADLNIDSPYNTYLIKGLPLGPINNPSLEAIDAVLHPTRTDYIFFLAGNDGKMHYARTNAEHEANISRYLK